ncbi:hypothetical protein ES703_76378 [subsurface metagenome]
MNEEILEGLKVALSKGESFRDAMMSFYNAGYKKEEIEDAARALQMQQSQQVQPTPTQPPIKQVQPVQQAKPERRIQEPVVKPESPETIQKVSGYEQSLSVQKAKKGIYSAIKELQKIELPNKVKVEQVQPVQQAKPERRIQKPVVKPEPPRTIQKVSSYEQTPSKPKGKLIIIFLIFFLVILFGALASVFFFKDQLVGFFNNLF